MAIEICSSLERLAVSACRNLLRLQLDNNLLSVGILAELSSLHNLKKLTISFNKLSSIIPRGLPNCTELKRLDLGHNFLTSTIPKSLSNFWLSYICTPIPSEIFTTLTRLQDLELYSNKLNGSNSKEIGKLWRVGLIILHKSSLTSTIPMTLGTCSALEQIAATSNSLHDTIPAELGSLIRLKEL